MSEPKQVPDETRRKALYRVLYEAIIHARGLASGFPGGPETAREALKEIADLMDAIHNIPLFLPDLHGWDDELFRDWSLGRYDEDWSRKRGLKLTEVYDGIINYDPEKAALWDDLEWNAYREDD